MRFPLSPFGSHNCCNSPFFQTEDCIRLFCKILGVCYDYHTVVHLMGAFFQNICNLDRGILVKISCRLVRENNTCVGSQCTGDRYPLLLPAGELPNISFCFLLGKSQTLQE